MNKLLAYVTNNGILGVDVVEWDNGLLYEGEELRDAFIVVTEEDFNNDPTIYLNYEDISSIINWGKFGTSARHDMLHKDPNVFTFIEARNEIKLLKDSAESISEEEEAIIQKFKLRDYFKIFDFISLKELEGHQLDIAPTEINYNILGLFKNRIFEKGELTKVEYYAEFDGQYYSNLIINEDRTYVRVGGFVNHRITDITYYLTNDEVGAIKTTTKFYPLSESITEGIRRRNNIIASLKIDVIGLIAMVEGIPALSAEEPAKLILREIRDELNLFIEGDEMPLINKFKEMKSSRLDYFVPGTGDTLTIRYFILNKLIN